MWGSRGRAWALLVVAVASCESAALTRADAGADAGSDGGPTPGMDADSPDGTEPADAATADATDMSSAPDAADAGRCDATETRCDGLDDDCNGEIDEGVTTAFFRDEDGDGAGRDDSTTGGCGAPPAGFVTVGGDCDDADRSRAPTLHEVCGDGLDNDCDGAADGRCSPPGATLARSPWNGWRSGTLHAGARTLRPTLRWEAVDGVVEYRVALASTCDPRAFRSCDFSGATEHVVVAGTSYTPETDLVVSTEQPVGTRYYWRVRACVGAPPDDDATCGAWSEPRYLDVGRTRSDFDGDGYADLLVGAPRHDEGGPVNEGAIFLYRGSRGGPLDPRVIDNPDDDTGDARFGESVAAGDVDGDGFDDAIVGAFQHDEPGVADVGLIYVLRGSAAGLDEASVSRHRHSPAVAGDQLGLEVAAGDLDGDGDDDVLAGGWSATTRGLLVLFVSEASSVEPTSTRIQHSPFGRSGDEFGAKIAAQGDVDGDGFVDVLVSSLGETGRWAGMDLDGRGRVYVFPGGGAPLSAAPSVIESPAEPSEDYGGEFGRGMSLGDLDGDGFADPAVGAWRSFPGNAGSVFVFAGSRAGVSTEPSGMQIGDTDDTLGGRVAAGDMDGDGADELLVGAHERGEGEGEALLYRGLALDRLWEVVGRPNDRVGSELAMLDVNGDGAQDLAIAASQEVRIVFGTLGGLPGATQTFEYPGMLASSLFGRSIAWAAPPATPFAPAWRPARFVVLRRG